MLSALTYCELHKIAAVVITSWYRSTGHSDLVQAARSFDAARKLSVVGDSLLVSISSRLRNRLRRTINTTITNIFICFRIKICSHVTIYFTDTLFTEVDTSVLSFRNLKMTVIILSSRITPPLVYFTVIILRMLQ